MPLTMLQDNVHLKYGDFFLNPVTKPQKLLHKAELPHFRESISSSSVLDMYETKRTIFVHAVNTVCILPAIKKKP